MNLTKEEAKSQITKLMTDWLTDENRHSIFTNKCILVFDDKKGTVIVLDHNWVECKEFSIPSAFDDCINHINKLISKTKQDVLDGKLFTISPCVDLTSFRDKLIHLLFNGKMLANDEVNKNFFFNLQDVKLCNIIPRLVREYNKT